MLALAPVNSLLEASPDALYLFWRHPASTVLLIEDEPTKKAPASSCARAKGWRLLIKSVTS